MSMGFGGSPTQVGVLTLCDLGHVWKASAWHTVRAHQVLAVLLLQAFQGSATDEEASLLCPSTAANAGE